MILKDFDSGIFPTWCPGCGDFGIWSALKQALVNQNIPYEQIFIVFGIGCAGNFADFIKCYGFHSLHGRTLPVAAGAKIANHKLKIIAIAGDGDAYGEGLSHFINACRRNDDVTYIVHNNKMYSLTTGQVSPTADKGSKGKSTPSGVIEEGINPLALALDSGATFVSRGFAGDIPNLSKLFSEALKHKGFSLIDVLQPCVTFNKVNTAEWYRRRVYALDKEGHNTSDKGIAYKKTWEWGEKIPTGVFYQTEKPCYHEQLPQLKEKTLVERDLDDIDISEAMAEFG